MKQRLICIYEQDRHADMVDDMKYSWFLSFNSNLQPEKYLSVVTHKWHRSMLARFRTRTLGLNSNKAWFESEPTAEACTLCKSRAVENETHFIFHCEAYGHIRQKCCIFEAPIAKEQNLVKLLTHTNEKYIISLAKYIAEAAKLRRSVIST